MLGTRQRDHWTQGRRTAPSTVNQQEQTATSPDLGEFYRSSFSIQSPSRGKQGNSRITCYDSAHGGHNHGGFVTAAITRGITGRLWPSHTVVLCGWSSMDNTLGTGQKNSPASESLPQHQGLCTPLVLWRGIAVIN